MKISASIDFSLGRRKRISIVGAQQERCEDFLSARAKEDRAVVSVMLGLVLRWSVRPGRHGGVQITYTHLANLTGASTRCQLQVNHCAHHRGEIGPHRLDMGIGQPDHIDGVSAEREAAALVVEDDDAVGA